MEVYAAHGTSRYELKTGRAYQIVTDAFHACASGVTLV